MNTRKFLLASAVVFVVYAVLSYILHSLILDWSVYPGTLLVMGTGNYIALIIGMIVYAFMFTFIFTKGYENKGIGEGIRYGFYIGLFVNLSWFFFFYATTQYTAGLLLWGGMIGGIVINIILGICAAALYNTEVAPAEAAIKPEEKPEEKTE